MLKLKNSAMLVVAALCGYLALMTPDWKADLVANSGAAYTDMDLDGNNVADILWHNSATSNYKYWKMKSDATRIAGGEVDLGTVPSAWTFNTDADTDGNGIADLVFTNSSSAVRILPDGDVAQSKYPGNQSGYQLFDAGDFDGDGDSDLAWYNKTTGQTALWFMENHVRQSIIYPGSWTDLTYRPYAAGDFDNDGIDDIYWYNWDHGGIMFWKSFVRANKYYPGRFWDTGWRPVGGGVGDADGDGHDDLLFQNQSSPFGTALRRMVSFVAQTQQYPGTTIINDWPIKAWQDFEGDGTADVLLRATASPCGTQIWKDTNRSTRTFPGTQDCAYSIINGGNPVLQ